jgi:hypothetical protein
MGLPLGENILDAADLGRAREHALLGRSSRRPGCGPPPTWLAGHNRAAILSIMALAVASSASVRISSARMRQCAPLLMMSNGARTLSLFIFLPLSFLERDNVTPRQMADQRLASCLS